MATGPSTTQTPYIVALEPNVRLVSIAAAGDTLGLKPDGVTPFRFVGVPDGIGAYDNGNGTFTVVVNHEIGNTAGVVREHGSAGSFISRLVIDSTTFEVLGADDAIKTIFQASGGGFTALTTALARLCSGDLADVSAFYDPITGLGTQARIYLTGEETGPEGRAFGTVLTGAEAGNAYELASLGNLSFENVVANPFAQTKTVVSLTDDTTPGQVYIYVGDKQATGNEVEKAGLVGGKVFGISAAEIGNSLNGTQETSDTTLGADGISSFTLVDLGDVSGMTGAEIQAASNAAGISEFFRPEDSAWDPSNPNWLYFATTANFTGNSRLYRLEFADITQPELGGTLRVLLDGTEGHRMLDNLSVGPDGIVHLQEDVGNNDRLGQVYEYNPATDTLTGVAQFDPARFLPPTQAPFNRDEESSGIVDVTSILGDSDTRAFLLDAQAHYSFGDPEIVEGGQLLALFIDDVKNGTAGNDRVAGDAGNNRLLASLGDDAILGGSGNDYLSAGRGDDVVDGGRGSDVMLGNLGADTFVFDRLFAGDVDYIVDFKGSDGDTLQFGAGVTVTKVEVGRILSGDSFNGESLANSDRALDLQITLQQGGVTQTLHILDSYSFSTDSFWEAALGIELAYTNPVGNGVATLYEAPLIG